MCEKNNPVDISHIIECAKAITNDNEDWQDFVDWEGLITIEQVDSVIVDGVVHKIDKYGLLD
jgi:hypothetical protein